MMCRVLQSALGFLLVLGGLVACSPSADEAGQAGVDGVGEPAWVQDAVVYEVFIPDASEDPAEDD